jgi:hypothetical protein
MRKLVVSVLSAMVLVALMSCSVEPDRSARDIPPLRSPKPVWASGTELHYGRLTVTSPAPIVVFVNTDQGFVIIDETGQVRFIDPEGSATAIGHTVVDSWPHLVADDRGPLVGWTEPAGNGFDYVVYDTATSEVAARIPRDAFPQAMNEDPEFYPGEGFVAIDEHIAYVRTAEGFAAFAADTGERVGQYDQTLVDAANGILAFARPDGMNLEHPDGRLTYLEVQGTLNPDGSYLFTNIEDTDYVYDTATGLKYKLLAENAAGTEPIDRAWPAPLTWLSDGRLLAVDVNDNRAPMDLMVCGTAGTCSVLVADAGVEGDVIGPSGVR